MWVKHNRAPCRVLWLELPVPLKHHVSTTFLKAWSTLGTTVYALFSYFLSSTFLLGLFKSQGHNLILKKKNWWCNLPKCRRAKLRMFAFFCKTLRLSVTINQLDDNLARRPRSDCLVGKANSSLHRRSHSVLIFPAIWSCNMAKQADDEASGCLRQIHFYRHTAERTRKLGWQV